ncbi:uncharacterized protein LOC115766918 [Drosophila novamexicana]|uniref:uncharacterized protein LOC115766918 n=1 Tax=Drosophila novamexicana TaxID=47314 RepID=UPI0011E59BFC|nr:uncharacterized protein LOC115766918 [Drosophila novamexicana]
MLSKCGRQLLRASSAWRLRCLRQLGGVRMPQESPVEVTHTSLVIEAEARRFIHDCLRRVGVPFEKLRSISDFLLAADYRGVHGSGINRLEMYLRDLQQGYVDITADPEIISETPVTAHVDGNCAMGVFVGNYCMDLAVEKARKSGIGFVVAKRSHHIGMAAWYAFRAMAKGYISLVLSNAAPMLMAPGAQVASLGANCLAFGADATHSHFMLDMAVTMKEIGAVEWAYMKNEFIPKTWAADESGLPTCFPSQALRAQRLYPAGGNKGYCLAAMIDVLCGVMSGANYATRVPRWWSECQVGCNPNLGLVMLALDPCVFVPDFHERLDDFRRCIETSSPLDEAMPVRMAGQPEKQHMYYVDDLGALPFPNVLLAKFKRIADLLCVKPMELAFASSNTQYHCM